jgi:cation diffusion facilitator family transporter
VSAAPSSAAAAQRAAARAALVSVGVGLAVLSLKVYAAWRTESLALLADAAESVVNLVAALVAAVSLGAAARPGDGPSPFGHGKMEYLSAAIEGALVVCAAFVVAFESFARYGETPPLAALPVGLGLSVAATAGTAALARYLDRAGRRHRAPELLVEALHLRADVVISLVVYAGVAVAWSTSSWRLDALVALGVSLHILISGMRAVRHSVSGLLDETLSSDEVGAIEARLRDEGPPVVGFHDLRSRRSGQETFIELHLVISRYALVYEAHAICERLRADLALLVPGATVRIHVEPEGDGAASPAPRMTL